jgi:hypothetical protein
LTAHQTDLLFQERCMSKRTFSYLALLLGMFFFIQPTLFSQNDLSSEAALKKEAQKAYDDEDFGAALKFYSRLLSVNLKDPLYNYRYGVCLLEASPDKDEAIKYIEKAVKDPEMEKEVFFFYGKALQLNYRFNDAIAAFTKYKSLVNESKTKKMQVDHLIETCKNGKSLLRKITDLQVVDRKDLEDKDFFLSYDLTDIGGRLLIKPDDFKTSLDKKKKEQSIIFLSQDKSEIYFSSYGNSDENGKDIYVIKLLPSGEYSKPVSLGYPINTEFDEDYPFLHPNGRVLYFASKGHNSMGGYDIFKSERNEETGTWGKPVNLDFPINTPDDDILYVTDKDEKTAFFASRRNSPNGRIDVYRINTERRPVEVCIFKGRFIPFKPGQSQAAKITVKNVEANEVESVIKSNEGTGEYTLNLPNGGKFLITVETLEGDVQSDVLVIPQQFETVPVRQEIGYKPEDGKLKVNSLFGQSLADDDNYALPIDFIKDRSKLDVNTSRESKEPAVVLPEKKDTTQAVAQADTASGKKKDLTNEDLIHIAEQDAADLEKDAADARAAADKALVIVNEKNQKAVELDKKTEDANASAAAITESGQKQIEQSRADALQVQANAAEVEALAANNFYKGLDADAQKKQKEADLSKQYAKDLSVAIQSKSKDAMARLDTQKDALDKLSEDKSGAPDDLVAGIRREADDKQKEVNKVRDESAKIRDDIRGIETEISNLNRESGQTQNQQLKDGINSQITQLKEESKNKERDLSENDLKLGKLQKEAENLANQAYLVHQMNEQIKSGQVAGGSEAIDKEKLDAQISQYYKKTSGTNPGQGVSVADTSHTITEINNPSAISSKETHVNPATKTDAKYNESLTEAGSKGTEQEKELAKAEVLTKWSDELNATIASKKEEIKLESDKERQQKLLNDIAALEKQQEEKSKLASDYKEKAHKLKETSVASEGNNPTSIPAGVKEKNASMNDNSAEVYNQKLQATDTISDPVVKVTARADAEKERSNQIESEINIKKQERNSTEDPQQKEKLNAEIIALQKEAQVHKDQSEAGFQKARILLKEPVAASGISETYGTEFSKKLANSDQLSSGINNDSVKAILYQEWVSRLRGDIESKKTAQLNENDPDKKKADAQEIADLETELTGKEAAARRSEDLAEKRRSKNGVGVRASSNESSNYKYTSSAAVQDEQDRSNKHDESIRLKVKADSVRGMASALQGDEKKAQLAEAERLDKESQVSQNESIVAAAQASEAEYAQNEQKLKSYETQSELSSGPGVEGARSSTNEAKAYFEKARIARKEATSLSGPEQEVKLKEAAQAENSAFAKQNESILAYSKADVSHMSTDTSRHIRTSGNQNLSTEDKIVKSDSISQVEINAASVKSADSVNTSVALASENQTKENKTATFEHSPKKGADTGSERNNSSDTSASGHPQVAKPAMSPEKIASIKKTETYKKYLHLKARLTIEQEEIAADNARIQEYQQKAQNYMREGNQIIATASSISDTSLREDAMRKAKELDELAAVNFSKVDSIRDHARKLSDKANLKQQEAQESLASSDTATRQDIVYLASAESPKNLAIAAGEPLKTGNGSAKNNSKAKGTIKGVGVAKTEPKVNSKNTDTKSSGQVASGTNAITNTNPKNTDTKIKGQNSVAATTTPKTNAKNTQSQTTGQKDIAINNTSKNNPKNTQSKTPGQGPVIANNTPKSTPKTSQTNASDGGGANNAPLTKNKATDNSVPRTQNISKGNKGKASNSTETGVVLNKNKTTKEPVISGGDEVKTTEQIAKTSAKETFMITSSEAVAKIIPIDTKLPEGLVYKVQVGAFRNPISGDLFKGVSPLMGETTTKGFIRYTAGIFINKDAAEKAKKEVRALGFNDAFVVAFYNGKRISIDQASSIATGTSSEIVPETINSISHDTSTGIGVAGMPFRAAKPTGNVNGGVSTGNAGNIQSDSITPNSVATGRGQAGLIHNTNTGSAPAKVDNAMPVVSKANPTDIVNTTQVTQVKGLFYTIQVGVYSNPVTNAKLYGIQPLNSEKLVNGTIRYTSGQYSDLTKANEAKAKIIQLGIKDAFVVVYDDGKRIPLVNQKTAANTGNPRNNENTSVNTGTEQAVTPVPTTQNVGAGQNTQSVVKPAGDLSRFETRDIEEAKADSGIVYKVQIGAFKDEVPVEIANKFLLLAKRGVRNFKDENGNTVFTIGRARKFEDAQFLKEEALAKGIPDAFIIAQKDGKKIPLSEARSAQ